MVDVQLSLGSSPQARGTQVFWHLTHLLCGLIPAGAGNTSAAPQSSARVPAHPRRRGEHLPAGVHQLLIDGSSPQARGTRVGAPLRGAVQGLIPAGAGNTAASRASMMLEAAHPRRRGEHSMRARVAASASGSSPQARGTPGESATRDGESRLIPAGAGNTSGYLMVLKPTSAHPRRRGEHHEPAEVVSGEWGSSPQARGTLRKRIPKQLTGGLIPAGAGNTLLMARRKLIGGAHPRRRGEHLGLYAVLRRHRGSSPQARGTRASGCLLRGRKGLIPAGAGNT